MKEFPLPEASQHKRLTPSVLEQTLYWRVECLCVWQLCSTEHYRSGFLHSQPCFGTCSVTKLPVCCLAHEEERKGLFEIEIKAQGFVQGVEPLPRPWNGFHKLARKF